MPPLKSILMKKHFLIISNLFFASFLLAQSSDQRIYREVASLGLGLSEFRDLATSPLTYRGVAMVLGRGKWKIDDKKETYFGTEVKLGLNTIFVGGQSSTSFFVGPSLNYTRLYSLQRLAKNGWDYKIGGKIDGLMFVRFNSDFRNNSVGFEAFPTLFGSFKISKNFERHPFFRKKRAARKQAFSLTVDIGAWNNTFRNNFAYTNHTPFFNDQNIFRDYQFQWFNGFRIKTAIDYIIYSNKNSNAFKVAYKWEGLHSGRTADRFAIGVGFLQLSLLHRLN